MRRPVDPHNTPAAGQTATQRFGLLHLDPPHVVATAVMGVMLQYAYLTTRSLWVPVLLHFLNNSLAILSASLGWNDPTEKVPVSLYIAAAALGAAVGLALYQSRVRLAPAEG